MKIVYQSAARKALKRLPKNLALRIVTAIDKLPQGDVTRLKGRDDYRLRVGEWRVIFERDGETISVTAIAPRGGVYR